MKTLRYFVLAGIAAACMSITAPRAAAQISVSIGAAPVCPYGYFDYAPYSCAPYGYYGPDWFTSGVFIGAGPWYHGHEHFYGHVNNRFDPHHGYHGALPHRGDHPEARNHMDRRQHFHGNEMRDGHGHSRRH